MNEKFEYQAANVKIETAQGYIDYLNKKGDDGWQLVSSAPSNPPDHVFCVFMRKKGAIISPIR